MIKKKKSSIVLFIGILIATIGINAKEPQSSLFTIEFFGPTVHVNSLQSSAACPMVYNNQSSGDLHFRSDSIVSDFGILYDETVESRIKNLINSAVTENEARYFFDFLLSKEALVAPQTGYTTTVPAGKAVYFIKTSANTYGLIINYGSLVGAIDRYKYYLVISGSDENRLYKQEILELPDSIHFVAEVFSGRYDPSFTIKKRANIKKLIYALYNATDFFGNPSLRMQTPDSWPVLNSFAFTGIFTGCSDNNTEIKVTRGIVAFRKGSNTVYLRDFSSMLYMTVIEAGRDENPVSVDQYGPVYFKDLFPLVKKNEDSISNAILVNVNKNVTIKDVGSIRGADGFKLYVATGESGLYSGTIAPDGNGIGLKDSFIFTSTDARIVSSVLQLNNLLYIGTRDGVYKSSNGTTWNLDGNGIPASPQYADPVTSLSSDDSTLFAIIGEKNKRLYSRKVNQPAWENALEKFNITLDTPVENLPENLPFEIRKFYLTNCHLVTTGDSIYKPVKNSFELENWSINSVVQVGTAIIASINNTCNQCSNPSQSLGIIVRSFDNGKTFKVIMKSNLVSNITLLSNGDKVFFNLELIPSSIRYDWAPGLYISEDYGTSWLQYENRYPLYNVGLVKMIGNYICMAEDSGSIYLLDISSLQSVSGPTNIKKPERNEKYKSTPLYIGNRAITLQLPDNATDVTLLICNLQGKVIQKISRQSSILPTFNSPGIGKGMYLLKVITGNYQKVHPVLLK